MTCAPLGAMADAAPTRAGARSVSLVEHAGQPREPLHARDLGAGCFPVKPPCVCRRDEPHMTARSEARSADDHRAWHGVVRRVVRRSRESAACRHCWSSSCSTTSSRASSLPLCSSWRGGCYDIAGAGPVGPGRSRVSCCSARRPCGHCPSTIQTPDPSWLPAGSATLRGTSFISVRTVSCRAGGLSGVWFLDVILAVVLLLSR